MRNEKYRSYDRIHKYDNPSDIETGKIIKETHLHKKLNNRGKRVNNQIMQDFNNLSDEMLDKYDEYIYEAQQQRRTAKGHKNRLNELKKRKDFN